MKWREIKVGLEKITELRKKSGLSLEELSIKSGVPRSTLSKISAGITKNPNLETVQAICDAIGCTLDDLAGQKENAPSEQDDKPCSNEDVENLYRALVASGMIPPGGDLTDRQLDFLDGIATVISAFFDKKS